MPDYNKIIMRTHYILRSSLFRPFTSRESFIRLFCMYTRPALFTRFSPSANISHPQLGREGRTEN